MSNPIVRAEHNPVPLAVAQPGDNPAPAYKPLSLDVDVRLSVAGNVCVVMNTFRRAGDAAPGHRHHFDHMSLLTNGAVAVDVNGARTIYRAPRVIFIPRDTGHQFTALEPDTVLWCVHAARDIEGNVLDTDAPTDTPLHSISKGI